MGGVAFKLSAFEKAFLQAASAADAIRFELTSFKPDYNPAGITKWELDQILNNEALYQKTTFVKDGKEFSWNGKDYVPI